MKHRNLNLLLFLAPAIIIGATAFALNIRPENSRVYTVSAVVAGLYQNPQAWIGRTVRLRGIVRSCGTSWSCHGSTAYLEDSGTQEDDRSHQLQLVPGPPDPSMHFWRQLPGLSAVLPRPQRLNGVIPSIYRVTLTADMCAVCFEGIVQDAAP
jgi:hypothetical protein